MARLCALVVFGALLVLGTVIQSTTAKKIVRPGLRQKFEVKSDDAEMRDFGPNTSGENGEPATIDDVYPPFELVPLPPAKPDQILIVKLEEAPAVVYKADFEHDFEQVVYEDGH